MKHADKYESQIIRTGERNNIEEDIIAEAVEMYGKAVSIGLPPKSWMNRVTNMMLLTKQEID